MDREKEKVWAIGEDRIIFRNKTFYHQHIRKAIIAFGTLFNGLYIDRNNAEGVLTQRIKVPLSYVPKQKFIARIGAAPDLETGRTAFEVVLPRIGFEIKGLEYDGKRKLTVTQRVKSVKDDGSLRQGFISTPYNLKIDMSVYAKNQDDGLQIIEQILPHFNPDFNVTVNEIPVLGVSRDLQFVLDSVDYEAEYESDFKERVKVIYNLHFTVKINFFGFVDDATVIKKTIISLYSDSLLVNGVVPTGTLNGERITTTTNPYGADPNSDYVYVQEFDELFFGELG